MAKRAKSIKQLQKMAKRASDARDAFEEALEFAKQQSGWEKKCEKESVAPEADVGDWMC